MKIFFFSFLEGSVQEMIFKSGLIKSIDLDQIFLSVHDAVLYILSQDQVTPEVRFCFLKVGSGVVTNHSI